MQSIIFTGQVAKTTESGMSVIAGTEQNPVLVFVKPMSNNGRAAVDAASPDDYVLVSGEVAEAKMGTQDPYYIIEAYQIEETNTPAAFNKFQVIGRLGQQPVLRHTAKNNPVTNLSVAVGRGDSTVWIQVTAWGRQAETAVEYLGAGSVIAATGVLKAPKPWGDPPRVNIEMTAFYIEFLSPPRERAQDSVMTAPVDDDYDYDEIPF